MEDKVMSFYEFVGKLVIEHPVVYAAGCLILGTLMNIGNFWLIAKLFGLL